MTIRSHNHHATKREVAPGVWKVARPARDTSWWFRWKQERACRKSIGHCWHPDGFATWWCCVCSAETDGTPPHRCAVCADVRRLGQALKDAGPILAAPSRDEVSIPTPGGEPNAG